MKNRGTNALLVLFFTGLCGLWLADYARLPTRRDRDRLRNRVLPQLADAKPDDLRKIEIVGAQESLVFERREGNRWQMTSPADVAADPSKVETLAYNLKELARKPEADTLEGDPSSFGLAPPDRTIRLWGPSTDAPIATLELGKTSLDRRYVRSSDSEGIEVVDARALDLVKLPPRRWRDHELFRVPSFEVDAVDLVSPGATLKLRRDPDSWRVVAPIKALAAENKVDGLIADLGSLRVIDDTRFIADDVRGADLEKYGLKVPWLTVEVAAGRGDNRRPSQVLHVGKAVEGRDGQVYARRGDQDDVVAVDNRVLKDLQADPNKYRSPRVADIQPARVVRIGVETAGHDFEVARSSSGWTIVRPTPALADGEAVQNFLKSLSQLQTSIYLNASNTPEPGLDPPSMVLKVWQAPDPRDRTASSSADPKGELALMLRVGRRDALRKTIYARTEGDSTILGLPDSADELLPRSPLAFRDRLVLALATSVIERLEFVGPGRKVALNAPMIKLDPLANAPIGWWMVEPVVAPADSSSVGRLLKLLSGLRAENYVAERPDDLDRYGLKTPALKLTWSTLSRHSMEPEPPKSDPSTGIIPLEEHSLIVGSSVIGRPGVRYAMVVGRPLVFTINAEALGAMDSEFHDRRVLAIDPTHVQRVHIDWADRAVSVTPAEHGGRRQWSIEGPAEVTGFDPGRVEALLKATSNLTTPRFVQYDGDLPALAGLTPPRVFIRFDLDDGTGSRELRVGNPAGNNLLIATTSTGGKGPAFLVPEAFLGAWTRPPRRIDDLPEDVFEP